MRKIVLYPSKILRKKVELITVIDKRLSKEIKDLREALGQTANGAGLAAPQLGISKRFLGIKNSETKKVEVLINPEITKTFGDKSFIKVTAEEGQSEDFLEGCLSFPKLFGTVKRYLKVEAKWEVIVGGKLKKVVKTLDGYEAVVFQHEVDHLDGILFIDHVKEDGGKLYRQDGEKMEEIGLEGL